MKYHIPAILLLASLAPVLVADERDDYRKMIEQQKKHQEQFINRLELLPGSRRRLDQIFTFAIEGKMLALKSPLLDASDQRFRGRQFRAEIEGFPTPCMIMAHFNPGQQRENWYFTFSNTQYPDLQGVATFSINAQPSYLNFSRNFNSRTRNYSVNFTQSSGRAQFGQPDGVQLAVFSSDNTGRMTANLNLSEPDFLTLRRKHGAAVREHLRPLFRDLHLENLFAVETITAWQVFPSQWPGNASLAKQVRELIPALDVDGYQEREEATTALRKLGPYAALAIYLLPREGLSMEQNTRLDAVVASYGFLSRSEAQRLQTDLDFLLDCLYCETSAIRQIAHQQLCRTLKREIPFDPDAPADQRETKIEALRAQLAPTTRPATAPTK